MNIEEIKTDDEEEIIFEQITFNTEYKIKKSIEEAPTDLELKPLPKHLEYAFSRRNIITSCDNIFRTYKKE